MVSIDETVRTLTANAAAIRMLMQSVSAEQAAWKPGANTWSLKDVMEHVYNEERIDFRMHLQEIFIQPPQAWGALIGRGYLPVSDLHQALEGFLVEREASLTWLESLDQPDWDASVTARFGENEVITLRAGDILASWIAHDYLHIRQMNELLFAWNEQQAKPYGVEYAGGW